MATAEFSKFAGILSVALSQHHLSGFEIAQAGIMIAGRNINNLRYADYITFMAEREEELKSLLMKVKEESEKAGLKFNMQKLKLRSWHPVPSLPDQYMGKQWQTLFFWWGPPKSLQMYE